MAQSENMSASKLHHTSAIGQAKPVLIRKASRLPRFFLDLVVHLPNHTPSQSGAGSHGIVDCWSRFHRPSCPLAMFRAFCIDASKCETGMDL